MLVAVILAASFVVSAAVLVGSGPGRVTVPDTEPVDTTFTVVVLPDTQNYLNHSFPGRERYAADQIEWVVAQRADRDIVFASHVGDVVENGQSQREWDLARPLLDALHDSGVPFGVAPGNHDLLESGVGPAYTSVLPASRFSDDPWYRGSHDDNLNSYQVLSHGDDELLFLHVRYLGYGSIDETLAWARDVLADHPEHLVFVTTHEFAGADGEVLQQRFRDEVLAPACNVVAVFSGHVHAQARGSFADECGRTVPYMLSNYQHWEDGGLGYLRIYDVDVASMTVRATTYSPSLDHTRRDGDNTFTVRAQRPAGASAVQERGERRIIVPFGSTWAYFDQGAPPVGWHDATFDDGAWRVGAAEFGFGDGDEITAVASSEPDGARTAAVYFRTAFRHDATSEARSLTLRLLADDGAVVWLNGQRVADDNMPDGAVDHRTTALVGRWGSAERGAPPFELPVGALQDGWNTLAVEVHQHDPESSDVSFDAQVELVVPNDALD